MYKKLVVGLFSISNYTLNWKHHYKEKVYDKHVYAAHVDGWILVVHYRSILIHIVLHRLTKGSSDLYTMPSWRLYKLGYHIIILEYMLLILKNRFIEARW